VILLIMNKKIFMILGKNEPKSTKRNRLIQRAVKKAVKEYKQTFIKLANA
jgi:hypothetical protein